MRLLLAFFTLFIFLLTIPSNLSPAFAHSGFQIVKMTPSGFEPRELTTDTNSVIMFVNQDTVERWPASNTHPTHELYSEFDPKKPIELGASWAFKPKVVGTFKFHDHLNPHFRVTLTVNQERSLSGNNQQSNPFLSWLNSIKEWFTSRFNSKSPPTELDAEKKWEEFKIVNTGQVGSLGNIHDQAHLIGGQIFDQKGFEGLSICSSDFAFGCYHGFLDKAFEKSLDGINLAEAACSKLGNSGSYGSCIHGIGHGIASFYQTNDLNSSLKSCQSLKGGSQYCFDGVFMEFERAAPLDFYSKENPIKPCDSLEKDFGSEAVFACGRNQPTVLMDRFKFAIEEVIKVCLEAKSSGFKEACFDSLGFRSAQSGTSEGIINQCQKIGVTEFIARCTKSGAGELIFQEVPNWQVEAPKTCASIGGSYQQDCQIYLQNLIKDYSRVDK